jgi:hypothetical protein
MALTSAQVETAIASVLSGNQAYTLEDGTRVERANLDVLIKLRDRIKLEEVEASSSGGVYVPVQFRRDT